MSSYSYSGMKPKPDMFASTSVVDAYDSGYHSWQFYLEYYDSKWPRLEERFAEEFQFAILRALPVVGVLTSDWNEVFSSILNERDAFSGLSKAYLAGELRADWREFAERIAMGHSYLTRYPPFCPEWLVPFGYTQRQYLDDLTEYWDNIHDDYFKLWENERIGMDSPEVARLKRLGEVARQEIDDVARHSGKYLGYD